MKSMKKKISFIKPSFRDTPLLPRDQISPGYEATTQVIIPKRKTSSLSSSNPASNQHDNVSSNSISPPASRPHSPSSPSWETSSFQTIKQTKQDPPWVREAREQVDKEPLIESTDVTFDLIRLSQQESWLTGISQTGIILLIFIILPSVFFAIAGLIFIRCAGRSGRSKSDKRKFRMVVISFVIGVILSVFKDSIIAVSVLDLLFKVTVSEYEIIFSDVLFACLLLLVAAPIMIFMLLEVNFTYNDNNDRTQGRKQKPNKAKSLAENFMKKNFECVHHVTCLKEQAAYLVKCVQRWVTVLLFGTTMALCIVRNFTPWLLRTNNVGQQQQTINASYNENNTQTVSIFNSTITVHSTQLQGVVTVLSALNAFVVAFFLSCVFAFSIMWQIVMLQLWRSFSKPSTGENDLISAGPDGIAAWWRVYQTLRYLTWSAGPPAGYIRFFMHIFSMVMLAVLSVCLISDSLLVDRLEPITVLLMVIDNILLLLGLVINWILTSLISSQQQNLTRQLSLKLLNATDKLGKVGSAGGDAERGEGEYHASLKKFKARSLRASVQILQEMLPALKNLETSSMPLIYPLSALVILVVGFGSSVLSIKNNFVM